MKIFLLVWLGYNCPGGILSGLIPKKLRPFMCEQIFEAKIISERKQADRFVIDHGPGAQLWEITGSRLAEKKVKWHQEVEIEK